MLSLQNLKEEYISYNNLLKHVSEYDIYSYYLGNFELGRVQSSPFREDKSPSFGVYLGNNGVLMFNDYLLGSGDCVHFVRRMENCSYMEALGILNDRYKLGYNSSKKRTSKYTHTPIITNTKIFNKIEKWIDIKIRPWNLSDKEFWSKYEITLGTLEFYNVLPISRFWLNSSVFNADKLSYAYYFEPNVFKIYQPYSSNFKWLGNVKKPEVYQGSNQLTESGEILFITSSLKDVMVLHEAGYSAIAPHTEHQILSNDLFTYYNSKWDAIIVLYDNDDAGITHANKMVDKYGIKSIILPEEDTKDPSDFVKKYDLESLKEFIKHSI